MDLDKLGPYGRLIQQCVEDFNDMCHLVVQDCPTQELSPRGRRIDAHQTHMYCGHTLRGTLQQRHGPHDDVGRLLLRRAASMHT